MDLLFSILTSAFWVILAITILVFIHELGHFLTAKWFGMRVERFSVGFPPKLFGKTYGGTEYVVGATPLGGYVKISGMIDESLDTDHVESEPEPWEFRSKPVWQRIVVITAGVIFNMILAVVIFSGLKATYGETYVPAENIDAVYVDDRGIAHQMGLRTGDKVVAVNGQPLDRLASLTAPNALLADTVTVTVEREGEQQTFTAPRDLATQLGQSDIGFGISYLPSVLGMVQEGTPADSAGIQGGDRIISINGDTTRFWGELVAQIQASEGNAALVRWLRPDSLVEEGDPGGTATVVRQTDAGTIYEARVTPERNGERYVFGIGSMSEEQIAQVFGIQRETFGPLAAIEAGLAETWNSSKAIVVSLKRIATGRDDLRENLGGPVRVAQITSEAASAGPSVFWRIVALLSITLAIFNILPIPALDGGQLVFLLYEGITRRKPSTRVRLVAQQVGMILLLGFMVFLIFNDILRL